MSSENGAIDRGEGADDLVGIGFGPANLALAIAVDEHNRRDPQQALKVGFLEKQATFGWHRGMLLEGATMQVSFLKDLVTMRDPRSRFTFLTYLQEREAGSRTSSTRSPSTRPAWSSTTTSSGAPPSSPVGRPTAARSPRSAR